MQSEKSVEGRGGGRGAEGRGGEGGEGEGWGEERIGREGSRGEVFVLSILCYDNESLNGVVISHSHSHSP